MCGAAFPAIRHRRPRLRKWTGRLTAAYVLAVAAGLALLWAVGEDWWPGTLLLYGPRWPFLVPLLPLGLAAAAGRRRALVPLAAAGVAWAWFGMGYTARGAIADREWPAGGLVVLTWNTEGPIRRAGPFRTWVAAESPDVILFQEWDGGPAAAVPPGWKVVRSAGRLWCASPHPVRLASEVRPDAFRRPGTAAVFEVDGPGGTVRVANVHLPTARPGLEAALAWQPGAAAELAAVTADQADASETARLLAAAGPPPLVVAGDFNLPPESRVFRRHWGDLGNAFAVAGFGFGWTKQTRWHGARIDHILYDRTWVCVWCRVGPDLGSDHRPLVAHLAPAARVK